MQEVVHRQIAHNVNLTCVRMRKFKTACLSVTLLTGLERETAAKSALLPSVLRRGTAVHPDMESLAAALDGLYGAQIEPLVRKKGEVQCVGFRANFVDDDFVPAGENVLENTAALLGEILLDPATRGGQLRGAYVDGERENLINEIRGTVNDKGVYAMRRLFEVMCPGERFATMKLGTEAAARKITAAGLTKHYRTLIATAPIEIFYCGGADPDRVERALTQALSALPRRPGGELPVTQVRLQPVKETLRVYREALDVTQGKLAVGMRLGEAMNAPNVAVLRVLNTLYGGGVTSKLFRNVRERLSLCYYASSAVELNKGILLVSSGIEFDKYAQALEEILRQLDAVKAGDFTPEELKNAKSELITALQTTSDSLNRLEDYELEQAISGLRCTPEELAALADGVTKEEIVRAAAGIRPDAVYFLTVKEAQECAQ